MAEGENRVPGVGVHMAARLLPHGAAAHLREGRYAVRAHVGRSRQPFRRRADEFVAHGQRRHAHACAHDRVVGLLPGSHASARINRIYQVFLLVRWS